MGVCILILPCPPIQAAEAEVAAGCEWSQAEIVSFPHGLTVELFGAWNVELFMLRSDFSGQPERPRLEACFVALSCAAERILGEFARFFYRTHQETRFT